MDLVLTILQFAAYAISGVIVALTAIAPLTASQWDNKLLAALVWIHDTLLALVLPNHTAMAKAATAVPTEIK